MLKGYKAKILSLLLAILVWTFVVSSGEQVRKFPEPIQVEAFNLSEGLAIATQDGWETVEVYLSAEDEAFKDLKAEEFSAYVDLKGLVQGEEYELPVNLTLKNPNVRVARVVPSNIKVQLEELVSKELEVKVEVSGDTSANFTLGKVSTEPSKVTVEGAEEQVKQAVSAIAILELTGQEERDIDRQVNLQAVNDLGETLVGLELLPESVNIEAPLTQISDEKVVSIKANVGTGVPKAGYWLEKVEVVPPTVTLVGDPEDLEEIENLSTELVDVEGISNDLERYVEIILPEGTEVTGSKNNVLVKVSVTEQESSRELFTNMEVANLLPNLEVHKITPASLQVEVKGSFEALKNLEESNIKAILDLGAKEAGTYLIEINKSMIRVPYPLQLGEFEEEEIEIILAEKEEF